MATTIRRPQQKYKFPPPSHKWWTTRKGAMIRLLWDRQWHTQGECLRASKHRFGGVIGSLRSDGWDIDTRQLDPTDPASYEYKLVSRNKGAPKQKRKRLYLSEEATQAIADGIITDEAIEVASEAIGES